MTVSTHFRVAPPRLPFAIADEDIESSLAGRFLYVKIFGERNSGTNYLEALVNQNFLVEMLRGTSNSLWVQGERIAARHNGEAHAFIRQAVHDIEILRTAQSDFGWKHSAPCLSTILQSPIAHFTKFLVITKHPFSWLRSLHRAPCNFLPLEPDFSRFLRAPFCVSAGDGLPGLGLYDPPTLFRKKAQAYLRLLDSGLAATHVRYSALLHDFEGQVSLIGTGLEPLSETVTNIHNDVKGGHRQMDDFIAENAEAERGDWMSAEDRHYIVERIGEDIFRALGYAI